MAAKPLPSQEFLRECLSYDPETGIVRWRARPVHHFKNEVIARRFNSRCAGRVAGSTAKGSAYLRVNMERRLWRIHRLIWRLVTGEDVPYVDHKDTNPLNNRWNNLRSATFAQNTQNRSATKNRATPKGIRLHFGNWQVRVGANGRQHHIGTFATIDEARAAYKEAAKRFHGEFANFGSDD